MATALRPFRKGQRVYWYNGREWAHRKIAELEHDQHGWWIRFEDSKTYTIYDPETFRRDPPHVCFPLEVDGQAVRVHGDPNMTEEQQDALRGVVRAVREKAANARLGPDAYPPRR